MSMRRTMIGALLAAMLLIHGLAASALAVGSPFKGMWLSTDPLDGSSQMLTVSAGANPSVVYQDFFASSCDDHGVPATHWISAGRGEIDEDFLVGHFHKSGCGRFSIGAYDDFWIYDAATDTLIDSIGVTWERA